MKPFTYPPTVHVRRHGPRGYAEMESYRPWIRDEFDFRCVYCLLRERWGQFRGIFAIDHFLPIAQHPDKASDYDNLLYACVTCNAAKGDRLVPDPLSVLTSQTVHVDSNGNIQTDNAEAGQLIELLGLDSEASAEFRKLWLEIVALAEQHDPDLYANLMGYPADLPNLGRLRPPEGNSRPAAVHQSSFARRQAGTLPATY